jgi:hypothetical protein
VSYSLRIKVEASFLKINNIHVKTKSKLRRTAYEKIIIKRHASKLCSQNALKRDFFPFFPLPITAAIHKKIKKTLKYKMGSPKNVPLTQKMLCK